MSNYEKRDMSGSLFNNDRKEKDSHPDFQGDIVIEGKHYWLSAWVKEGAKGRFFSLSAKPKEQRREEIKKGYKQERRSNPLDDLDDEIPF